MSNKLSPLSGPVDASGEPEGPMVPFLSVLRVWHKWRKALPTSAFTHSDGLKFIQALDDLLAAAAVPSSPAQERWIDDADDRMVRLPPSSPVADSPTWQPIETAPIDGTRVIIAWPNGAVQESYFSRLSNRWNHNAPITPTHWMPLPSAPSASAAANKEKP